MILRMIVMILSYSEDDGEAMDDFEHDTSNVDNDIDFKSNSEDGDTEKNAWEQW